MVNVFITIDTEIHPLTRNWRDNGLSIEFDRFIYGITSEGEFGIRYQMDVLDKYGLKAVFFIESLFACSVGIEVLNKIVRMVQDRGHDIQLHIHTEWLRRMSEIGSPKRNGQNMKDFPEEEQVSTIAQGVSNLRACGVDAVCAFRAGNFGADFNTLRALSKIGITYDSSYDPCYLDSFCGLRTPEILIQPELIDGVYEFPVSCFKSFPGRYRHTQLCACSWQEMEHSLLWAWEHGWYSFVLVLHTFEMLKRPIRSEKSSADRIIIRRFEELCRFLGNNRDKFRTALFSEISPNEIPSTYRSLPYALNDRLFTSGLYRTTRRFVEQILGTII